MSAKFTMIWEGKVAIAFFISYILLVLTIFQGRRLTEAWSIATGCIILGLSLLPTFVVPYTSVARRAAILGKLLCTCSALGILNGQHHFIGYA